MADLVADSPTIINHIVDVFKLAGATGGVIWYLSSRLTKTEKQVEANEASALARSGTIKDEIKLLKTELSSNLTSSELKLSGEISKLDSKLDKIDIKIAGEIRDIDHKIEAKIELINLKLKTMADSSDRKYDELEKQLTKHQDDVDNKIAYIEHQVKENVCEIISEQKSSPIKRKRVVTSKIQKA